MALSAALKARLKRLYLEAAQPYAALVAESGLGRFEFQSLVKSEKWGKRPSAEKGAKANATAEKARALKQKPGAEAALPGDGKKAAATKKKPAPKPAALVNRVFGTIEMELEKLENQTGAKSQDRERASRALSQMVNSLEKAVEMQREIEKDNKRGGGKQDRETLKNAEAKRKELAERIARFRASRAL